MNHRDYSVVHRSPKQSNSNLKPPLSKIPDPKNPRNRRDPDPTATRQPSQEFPRIPINLASKNRQQRLRRNAGVTIGNNASEESVARVAAIPLHFLGAAERSNVPGPIPHLIREGEPRRRRAETFQTTSAGARQCASGERRAKKDSPRVGSSFGPFLANRARNRGEQGVGGGGGWKTSLVGLKWSLALAMITRAKERKSGTKTRHER